MERHLRERGIAVERHRTGEGDGYVLSVAGGQVGEPLDVDLPGDLRLAYPLIVAGLARKGAELELPHVALRPTSRGFLDLLRQSGAQIQIEATGEDTATLQVSAGEVKATRVAGQRAARIIEQVPLAAVLATQCSGEFVLRDLEELRRGDTDRVDHLFAVLKLIGARAGEYPEGLVVRGVTPIHATRVDCKGWLGLAMALAVAGLLSDGEMVIENADCVDAAYPEFFATLAKLQERRK